MTSSAPSKKDLEKQVHYLQTQVDAMKHQDEKTKGHGWRKFLSGILVFLTAFTLVYAISAFWVRNTLFDTPTWVNKTTQIIQNSSVQHDISTKLVDTLFAEVNVQKYVSDLLPQQAQPLAKPLTSSIQSFTQDQAQKILGSDQFITFWRNANTSAHKAIIGSLNELNSRSQSPAKDQVIFIQNDQIILNVQPIIVNIKSQLSNAGLGFVDKINVTGVNTTFPLATVKNLPTVLLVFNGINAVAFWLPVLVLLFGAGAVWLSTNRRRNLIAIGITATILLAINSLSVQVGGTVFATQLSSNVPAISSQSAQAIYQILTTDLVSYYRVAIAVSLILVLFAFLSGPAKVSVWIRSHIADLLSGEMKTPVLQWLGVYAYAIIGVLVGLTAALIVLLPSVAGATLWLAVIVGIVSILLLSVRMALQNSQKKRRS